MSEEKLIIDQLKPGAEFETVDLPDELMKKDHAIRMMAEMAKAEGCEYIFGVTAGAEWPMEGLFMKEGIKRVHVRNELAATFAADAVGRLTRRPAITVIGPSTGLCYASAGLAQAMAAQSPMVVVAGEHPASHDSIWFAQGLVQAEKLYTTGHISKWTRRVTNPTSILPEFKRAIRKSLDPPAGPTSLAIPWDVSYTFSRHSVATLTALYKDSPAWQRTERYAQFEDPKLVEKVVRWLMEADKPAVVGGEGVWYDDAQEEIREFVRLTGIPTHCRRLGRGAISEYDPLNCAGRARGQVLRKSDRCLILGLRIGYLEMNGNPPFWGLNTRYVQAQTCRDNVDYNMPTEYELIGNIKCLLQQMIQCVKDMGVTSPPDKWADWRQMVAKKKSEYAAKTIERTDKMKGKKPLHPDLAGRLMAEFVRDEFNDDVIAVIDGFTASSFYTDWNACRNAGMMLDASETIGIGHGPGLTLGAGMATNRKKPIISLQGDGGLGADLADLETCVRWQIPAVFVHENNNVMVCDGWRNFWSKACSPTGNPLLDGWYTMPGIRYDKIMQEFGGHGEYVETDAELKPALKRAFESAMNGKPALVEVPVDKDVMNEIWGTFLTNCCGFLDWDDIPEEGQKLIVELGLCDPSYASHCPTWPPEALNVRKGGKRVK